LRKGYHLVYRLPTLTTTKGAYSLNSEGFAMTMTKVPVLAIAAGLLLAVSGPSFAAKRMSDTKSAVKSQSRAVKFPYPYSRDDPYAPGVNWPGKW
jgi:hypothetical protein